MSPPEQIRVVVGEDQSFVREGIVSVLQYGGFDGVDADQWFPVSTNSESAVGEAADAIAVCRSCQVRSLCPALSLLHWDVGQYGVWGGLVAADRASLRRQMLVVA